MACPMVQVFSAPLKETTTKRGTLSMGSSKAKWSSFTTHPTTKESSKKSSRLIAGPKKATVTGKAMVLS